jgi:hypothetical protein
LIFTMAGVHIRTLTVSRPITPTSPRCHSAWQPNLGRRSTYRRGKSVQTIGTSSVRPPVFGRVNRLVPLVNTPFRRPSERREATFNRR